MARIGFVGLGNMGAHMVRNLLKAGHEVSVYDLVPAAIASVTPNGAKAAANAADAARGAEIVITMLPAGQHVRDAWLGAGGMAAASAPYSCCCAAAPLATSVMKSAVTLNFPLCPRRTPKLWRCIDQGTRAPIAASKSPASGSR